ncbi:hypothetical protein BCEP4_370010 [Burkholderia cepacia]|nr:hypothetical protein BCEP4_370010 [Burkholderia cepacia]
MSPLVAKRHSFAQIDKAHLLAYSRPHASGERVTVLFQPVAPPKGHTRKLSGKRTDRVGEPRPCIARATHSPHSGERQ